MSLHGQSQRGSVVAYDITLNIIAVACLTIHKFLLYSGRCILPAHLPVFFRTIFIGYPKLIRQPWYCARWRLYVYSFGGSDGLVI